MQGTHDRNRHRDILARSADSGIDMQAEDHFDAVRSVVTVLCSVSLSAEYVAEAANRSCCEVFDSLEFRSARVGSILQLVYQTTARTIDQVARHAAYVERSLAFPDRLNALTIRQRQILALRAVCGFGVGDVATALSGSVEGIRLEQHRALSRLRVEALSSA